MKAGDLEMGRQFFLDKLVEWCNDICMRKPNCTCSVCKKDIYRRPSRLLSGNVYCGVKCHGIGQRNTKICPVCSKEYIGTVKKTCSRACANKKRSGIKYNGLNENNKFLKSKALKEKLGVIHKGVCEQCGNDNYNILQVHHKIERCNGGTNDLNNLMLLCPNCHMVQHYGYGKWRVE